jgi:hypothetical protein
LAAVCLDVNAGHGAGKPISKQINEFSDMWSEADFGNMIYSMFYSQRVVDRYDNLNIGVKDERYYDLFRPNIQTRGFKIGDE